MSHTAKKPKLQLVDTGVDPPDPLIPSKCESQVCRSTKDKNATFEEVRVGPRMKVPTRFTERFLTAKNIKMRFECNCRNEITNCECIDSYVTVTYSATLRLSDPMRLSLDD